MGKQVRRLPDDRFKKKRQPFQKPGTFRLFIAIFPPDEYREYFRNVLRQLDKQKRNLKPASLDQLHITVKFIGPEVTAASKDALIQRLTSLQGQFPKPVIKIKPVQFGFPDQLDPVHILSEIEDSTEILYIANMIHTLLKEMGLQDTVRWKVKHADSFHITMARIKPHAPKSLIRDVAEAIKQIDLPAPKEFVPEYLEVMESQTKLGGAPTYRKLAKIKL